MKSSIIKEKLFHGKFKLRPLNEDQPARTYDLDQPIEGPTPMRLDNRNITEAPYYQIIIVDYSDYFVKHAWPKLLTMMDQEKQIINFDEFNNFWAQPLVLIIDNRYTDNLLIMGYGDLQTSAYNINDYPISYFQTDPQTLNQLWRKINWQDPTYDYELDLNFYNFTHIHDNDALHHINDDLIDCLGYDSWMNMLDQIKKHVNINGLYDTDDAAIDTTNKMIKDTSVNEYKEHLTTLLNDTYQRLYYQLLTHYLSDHLRLTLNQDLSMTHSWLKDTDPLFIKHFEFKDQHFETKKLKGKNYKDNNYNTIKVGPDTLYFWKNKEPIIDFKLEATQETLDDDNLQLNVTFKLTARNFNKVHAEAPNIISHPRVTKAIKPATKTIDLSIYSHQPEPNYDNYQPTQRFGLNKLLQQFINDDAGNQTYNFHETYRWNDYVKSYPLFRLTDHELNYFGFTNTWDFGSLANQPTKRLDIFRHYLPLNSHTLELLKNAESN